MLFSRSHSSTAVAACRHFTPILVSLYKTLKDKEGTEDFELVFCSRDQSESDYLQVVHGMPWWCLPYPQSPLVRKLASYYECRGIPHLVVLDKDATVILHDGVDAVTKDPNGKEFPWRPKHLVDLLPATYIASDKTTRRPMSELQSKYLMLYFSAYWCSPCRQFTPKLSKAYQELQKKVDILEVLFVSSDHELESFQAYFHTMSFGAIPFEERHVQEALTARLGVRDIPTLVMVGPVNAAEGGDRPVINTNVRPIIERGTYLTEFPFEPKLYGDLNCVQDNINAIRAIVVFHECGDDEEHRDVHRMVEAASIHQSTSRTCATRFYWATESTILTRTVREALGLGTRHDPCMVLLDFPDGGSYYVSDTDKEITVDSLLEFLESPGQRKQM